MSALEAIKKRVAEDKAVIKEFEKMKSSLIAKDKIIKDMGEEIAQLKYQLENAPGDINRDAKLIADGEKKMPHGYYKESISREAKFEYTHKKQA